MKKTVYPFFLCLGFGLLSSQKLIPIDRYGVMTDSTDIKSLQEKYKLIGMFQKVSGKSDERRARVLKDGNYSWQWGFIDQTGKEIIPPEYTSASAFDQYGYSKVKINVPIDRNCSAENLCTEEDTTPMYYFIDKEGMRVSDYFRDVESISDEYWIGKDYKADQLIRKKDMKVLYESGTDSFLSIDSNTYKLSEYFIKERKKDGKSDLVNLKGEHLTNFRYQDMIAFNKFYFGLVEKDKKYTWYLLNKDFQPYGEDTHTETSLLSYSFNGNTIALEQKSGSFLVNEKGEIISEKYKRILKAGDFYEALKGDSVGLINKKGQPVTPFKYHRADLYQNRFILLSTYKDNKTIVNVYDPETNRVFDESFWMPGKKYIVAGQNKNFGIRNSNLKIIIPQIYKRLAPLGDTGYFLAINKEGKKGLINHKNKVIIPFIYDEGFFDIAFDFIVPDKEEDKKNIGKYWILFKKDGASGILNYKSEVIIPFENHSISSFSDPSVAVIWKDKKVGVMTRNKKVIPSEYDRYQRGNDDNGYYFFIKDEKLGAVDENNKVIIPFEMEDVQEVEEGFYAERYFVLRKRFGYSLIQKDGEEFYPGGFDYEPSAMKEGIGLFDRRILLDIYKNSIKASELNYNFDEEDFR